MATALQPLLRSEKPKAGSATAHYAPLPSVWYGEDAELLEHLLEFYPRKSHARSSMQP
jgi:hypothetical protein